MSSEREVLRKRSPLARRRVRVALVIVVLSVSLFTIARILGGGRSSGGEREHWRHHDEALVLFEAGRFSEAAERYRAIVDERPNDKTATFNLGLSLLKSDEAERRAEGWLAIEAVAARDPDFDAAHAKLAYRALAEGRRDDAIRALQNVVANPPEPPGARSTLAEMLVRQGRRGEALTHFRQVLDDDVAPALFRAQAALNLARQHGRRAALHPSPAREQAREEVAYKTALQIIETALGDAAAEGRRELLAMRPFALLALDRYDEALGAMVVALEEVQDPTQRAGLRALRAEIFWREGDETRARAELDAVLASAVSPDAATFLAVADLYESQRLRERAIDVLRRGTAAHPDDRPLRMTLARTLFLAGRPAEADLVLGDEDGISDDDDLMVLRGTIRRAQGDLVGARRAYQIVLSRSPSRADVRLRLHAAAAEMALTAPETAPDAIDDLERIGRELLAAEPGSSEARLGVARALLLRRDAGEAALAEAHSLLGEALELDPLLFEAHIAMAFANLRMERFDEAAQALERVIEALPTERPLLRVLLARAYLGVGDPRSAYEQAQRAVDGLGNDAAALTVLVRAAVLASEPESALRTLRQLAALEPDNIVHPLDQAFLHAGQAEMGAAREKLADAEAIAESMADTDARSAALRSVTEAKARIFALAGDVAGAKGAFAALIGRLPKDVEARVRYGRFLAATGDGDEAERIFLQAIRIDEVSLTPRRALVELWTDRGDLTQDLAEQVRRMRIVGNDDPVVLYAEGRLAALQGDLRTARERLEAAVAERPDDGDFLYALGIVLSRAGDLDAAVGVLERAVARVPESVPARDALSRARFSRAGELARVGRVRAARALLQETIRDEPQANAPRLALADLLRMTGEADLSESQIRGMLARDPDDVLARRMLATALARRGRMAEAVRELLRVTEAEPEIWTGWAALSAAYLELGDVPNAEATATRCRNAAPREPASLSATIQVLVTSERPTEAARQVEAAIVAAPEESLYRLMRAMLHAQAEEHEATVTAAAQALDLAPSLSQAARLAVNALRFGLGESERALEFATKRAERAPDVADLAYLVGWLQAQRGDPGGALATLLPLAEAQPPHQAALASCAMILIEQRDTTAARALLDAGLRVNPENSNFHFMRAQAVLVDALAMGDATVEGASRRVALHSLERVIELVPWHHTARNNLAFILSAETETLGAALEHAERAVKEAPGHAPYADTLGTIQVKLGQLDEAIATFEGALAVIQKAHTRLSVEAKGAIAQNEPERLRQLQVRLDRQEADLRAHYADAIRRRGD